MSLLAEVAPAWTTYLIAIVGSGGVLGAILGFFKLRGENDSRAVSQAQGAVETMADVQDALEKALARANERGDHYRDRYEKAEARLEQINRRWGPFPNGDEDGSAPRS